MRGRVLLRLRMFRTSRPMFDALTPTRLRIFRWLSCLPLALASFAIMVVALDCVAIFGWQVPFSDQFRTYPILLDNAFPANILQPENGHRAVLPNLLKLSDLAVSGGRQTLLIHVGMAFMLGCAAVIGFAAWKSKELAPSLRFSVFCLGLVALFWLGNARMMAHGNEAVQIYLVMLSLLVGAVALRRAHGSQAQSLQAANLGRLAIIAVLGSGLVASLAFGSGPAVFVAFIVCAVLLRLPLKSQLFLTVGSVLLVVCYTLILPSPAGVTSVLTFKPVENLVTSLTWLASVWVNGWIGLPQLDATSFSGAFAARNSNSILLASAKLLAPAGAQALSAQRSWALWIGASGLLLLLWLSALTWWRQKTASASYLLVVCLASSWFCFGVSLLVGLARLDYFTTYPMQIFAERYTLWSSMFWFGLFGALMTSLAPATRQTSLAPATRQTSLAPATRETSLAPATQSLLKPTHWRNVHPLLCVTLVTLIALAAWPTHRIWLGWTQAVDEATRVYDVATRQNLVFPGLFAAMEIEAAQGNAERTIALFRAKKMLPFLPFPALKTVPPALEQSPDLLFLRVTSANDHWSSAQFRRIQGSYTGADRVLRFVVIDRFKDVRGFGDFTHGGSMNPLHRRTGFDAFVRSHADANEAYWLIALGDDDHVLAARTFTLAP
jgi:hypothetical protein